jgi:hypothetical protein
MFSIGVDRDRVWLERLKRFRQAVKARNAGKRLVEVAARRGVAGAEAREIEAVDRLIGAGVAHAHRAEPDDQDAH